MKQSLLKYLSPARRNFTPAEDRRLKELVTVNGASNWDKIAKYMGTRNARQCRDRWSTYLDPSISNNPWSNEEDQLLVSKFYEIGPRWVAMTKFFVGRSDNSIKNRWHYHLKKQCQTYTPPIVSRAEELPQLPDSTSLCSDQMDFTFDSKWSDISFMNIDDTMTGFELGW